MRERQRASKKPPAASPSWARLKAAAKRHFGVTEFRPGQRELMDAVFRGKSALGILPTGAGKSLPYQLAALFLPGTTVVVSPLIALMKDQTDKLAENGVKAVELNSTLNGAEETREKEKIEKGRASIVYVTPERLEKAEYVDLLREAGVSLLVVDEAHCISQWGHDFRPAYLALKSARKALGSPPVLALTATATPDVADDILTQLGIPGATVVDLGIDRPNLQFEVWRTVNPNIKREKLEELLRSTRGTGIIYTATVRDANELQGYLASRGFNVARYHAKLSTAEREDVQTRFMSGELKAVVATKAFGLGIDKPDTRFVAHYHFPDSLESYYQEAGRAGRDRKPAKAVLLYRLEDRRIQGFFLGGKYPTLAESQCVYDAVRRHERTATESGPLTLARLSEETGIPEKPLKVILAQLEDAGAVRRYRRTSFRLKEEFTSPEALDEFLNAFEARHRNDREKLEAMMRYGQTTQCRVRFIHEYFGYAKLRDCGQCDNCRTQAARPIPLAS